MDGDHTGRNCRSGVSGHLEVGDGSGHHSISAITTSAMQIKRAIKVYQDRIGDDENEKPLLPRELQTFIAKSQMSIRSKQVSKGNKSEMGHRDLTLARDNAKKFNDLKQSIYTKSKPDMLAAQGHGSFAHKVASSMQEFWGYDKKEKKLQARRDLQTLGHELKILDRETKKPHHFPKNLKISEVPEN